MRPVPTRFQVPLWRLVFKSRFCGLTRKCRKHKSFRTRSCGRVAEGGGLLNRYTLQRRIEGSNPSGSASLKPLFEPRFSGAGRRAFLLAPELFRRKSGMRKLFCGRVRELLALLRFARTKGAETIRVLVRGGCGPPWWLLNTARRSSAGRKPKAIIRAECLEIGLFRAIAGQKAPKTVHFGKTGFPVLPARLSNRSPKSWLLFIVTH